MYITTHSDMYKNKFILNVKKIVKYEINHEKFQFTCYSTSLFITSKF